MRRHLVSIASTFLLMNALPTGITTTLAADTGESTLTTQTRQMDSLTTTRGETTVSGKISADFSAFAGSTANSDALVTGLRNGTVVTLTSTDPKGVTTSTTFTPPTGKMGFGNVYTSLALAKQQLAGLGITQPTAQQLQAALVGGTVTTASGQSTTLTGVLQMRSQGMGWGQIANSLGTKLGPVISGMKSANTKITSQSTATTGGTSSATTAGASASRGSKSGIVTGAGTAGSGTGQGHSYGRGIVTGGGAAAGQAGAGSAGHGKALGKGN